MKKHLIKLSSSCYLKSDGQIFLEENRVNIFIQHKLFFPLGKTGNFRARSWQAYCCAVQFSVRLAVPWL